jgi:hypothetical protein
MSEKTLPITLTGTYKGYQVAIQVESTLDSLDKLVNRLQARGIEPMPAPASANGKKAPQQQMEGTVTQVLTSKDTPKGKLVKLQMSTPEKEYQVVTAFGTVAGAMALANVNVGDRLQVGGYTKTSEEWGDSFIVQTWKRLQEAA